MPFRCLTQPCSGAQVGGPGGLILDHHQPLQRLQVVGHGALIKCRAPTHRIGGQSGQARLRGRMPPKGPQQIPNLDGITAMLPHPADVNLPHLFQVVAGGPQRRLHRPSLLCRPSADAY